MQVNGDAQCISMDLAADAAAAARCGNSLLFSQILPKNCMKIKKRLVRLNVPLPKFDNAVKKSFLIFLNYIPLQ